MEDSSIRVVESYIRINTKQNVYRPFPIRDRHFLASSRLKVTPDSDSNYRIVGLTRIRFYDALIVKKRRKKTKRNAKIEGGRR